MFKTTTAAALAAIVLAVLGAATASWGQEIPTTAAPLITGTLQAGDRVALCGDSITEARNYTCIVEGYLLACRPAAGLSAGNFGWGGETTWGFKQRIANDVLWFKPTVATVSYGMNDGGYGPVDPKRLDDYRESTRDIIAQLKKAGVRQIVLCGPGCVDSDTFRGGGEAAVIYNRTLAAFNKAAAEIAKEENVAFADMHTVMYNAMRRFKAKYPGKAFVGGDGVHPGNNGHTVMAYAVLKALGCDGNIGTISVDLSVNMATGSTGQKIVSCADGKIEVESSRYPIPIAHSTDPMSLGAALDVVPFNQDLNRYLLVVKNATAEKYNVTWGDQTRTFTQAELAAGVNLADAFTKFPYEREFGRLDSATHAQQDFEIPMMKQLIHGTDEWITLAPESEETSQRARDSQKLAELLRKRTAAAAVPVRHTITISAAK